MTADKKDHTDKRLIRPPRMAAALLGWLLDKCVADGAIGDMEERYHKWVREQGRAAANARYWIQVVSALPGCIRDLIVWRIVMFRNYLIVAWRNLLRHRLFSIINTAGLAIGMACCFLIMIWVRDEFSYDKSYPNSKYIHRIYRRYNTQEGVRVSQVTPAGLGPALKENYPEIVDEARYMFHHWSVGHENKHFSELIALADPSIFDIFSIEFKIGDRESALSQLTNIVLTEELARKYFGDENPVGRQVQIEDWYMANVSAVIKDLPEHTTLRRFGAIVDFKIYKPLWGRDLADMKVGNYITYVQLSPDADPAEVGAKVRGLLTPYFEDEAQTMKRLDSKDALYVEVLLNPLLRERLYNIEGGGLITYVSIFSAIGIFILLIACFNYMNLSTARSDTRLTEVGIRKVIGAGRPQLAAQFFGEAVLMATLAAVLAVLLVYVLIPPFGRLAGKTLTMNLTPGMILAVLGIASITGLLSGTYPALALSSLHPILVLKTSKKHGSGAAWFRRGLVTIQFTISIFLIIGSLVIFQQLRFIRTKDLGFRTENVINFPLTSTLGRQFSSFRASLLENPDIRGVTLMNAPPIYLESTASGKDVSWEGKTANDFISGFGIMGTDPDFYEIFKPDIIAGRFLSRDYPTDLREGVVLNQSAVAAMGLGDPIGKSFLVWDFKGRIIGVVKDFHYSSLHEEVGPLCIIPFWGVDNICIGIGDHNIAEAISFVESTIKQFEPGYSLDYRFIDDMIEENYDDERRIESFIQYGTGIAIFISAMGLLGLAAFTTRRRTKEIGIRKVLGSSAAGIVVLLSREFTRWVLVANVIAWPCAYLAARNWLNGFAYRTKINWWIFLASGVAALFIAFLTVGWQALHAARANPAESIRYE